MNRKEPIIRVMKRDQIENWKGWTIRTIAIVLALLVEALFVFSILKIPPSRVYFLMWEGSFGNAIYISDTVFFTAKLLCIAVALAPAFMMRFWNIGGEGQVLAGALATAIVMVYCSGLPAPLLYTIMFVAAVAGGAVWGLIPAVFKAKWNANETLFTLMMNYVAIQIVNYFYNKWRGNASALGKLNKGTKAGYLPEVFGSDNILILFIVGILVILVYLYLNHTRHGYEISVVGESKNTAKYAGMDVKKVVIRTMFLSGAICGVCGFMTVAGQDHSISSSTAGGYGFTAIIVAWLAKFNTIFMVIIALFIVFLDKGTKHIADSYSGFDDSATKIVIGIMLFFVIGSEFFINYKLHFLSPQKKEEE